jgi:hypothetical protein
MGQQRPIEGAPVQDCTSRGAEMAAAIIGLVGATVGALATLLGGALTQRWQDRRDDTKWRRDKRAAAYDGALRHLLRAANLRSEFVGGIGGAVLKQEHQREWFDDLVQAQFWMHAVSQYCGPDQLSGVLETARLLDSHVDRLLSSQRFDQKGFSIWETLQRCIATVTASTRADGGDHTVITSPHNTAAADTSVTQITMVPNPATPASRIPDPDTSP